MVNQEDILSLIQKEAWKPVLNFLYEHKKEIPTDSLLQYTTSVFESEFFEKMRKDNTSITFDNLRELLLLHHGKFFVLNDDNYKELVCELARQSTDETSLNYAKLFPDEKICREIIEENKITIKGTKTSEVKIEKNELTEIYNRLFEVINVKEMQAHTGASLHKYTQRI